MNWKPALEADARLAAKNALKIRAAIAQSFDSKRVLLQYQQTQPIVTKNPSQDRARARAWAVMNINPNMQPLKEVMLKVWAEGYVTGEAFADEQIKFAREISKADDDGFVDWKNWRPGDKATALLLEQPGGFKKLLASQGLTFKDFSNKTLFDIGDALAGAIELGLSPQRAAKQIQQHVANPARALSIAITEQNRAMSYATVNRFQDAGLEKMEWEVSSPCAVCAQNANQVVTIGQPFKSGATQPPQHPHCRCVLLPVIPDYAEQGAMPGAVVVTPPPAPVVPAERVIAPGSDVFVPGAWTILSKEEIREGIIDRYVAALPHKTREEIAVYVDDLRIAAPDKALMKSGVVYKNGPIQVNFYSTGAKLPEKNKQKVIDTIEKLQVMNPKKKVTINIGQESSSKYGWALLGGERLWITPKTARSIIPEPLEVGFKMPVLAQVSRLEYTLAHEWGHLIDEGGGFAKSGVSFQAQKTTDVINEAKRQFPDAFVSKYSLENSKEFYAEMFTEFFNSRGLTDNPLVQYMAKELGWKAPEIRTKTPKVSATSEMPYPWNPTLKYTKPEEFLNPQNYKFYAKELKEAAAAPLAMRIDKNSLQKVIKDGRFKSLSEVDTNFGGSREIVEGYRQNRIRLENGTWGIPKDVQQPLYGYMDRQITIPRTTGNTLQDPSVSFYGEIQIILKDDVKNRTTITLGDSLNTNRTPVEVNQALEGNLSNAQVSSAVDIGAYDYYEAQIHGGLSITDIKEIKLNGKTLSAADRQALLENGIIISE
jgi:hypothetical protein